MPRRDLTEAEIRELKEIAGVALLPQQYRTTRLQDLVERLTGEVLALRDREAHARHMHDLEGEY